MNLTEQKLTLPREAPGTILVPPDAFASAWGDAPREPALLGLRLVSASERVETIRLAKDHIKESSESLDGVESFELAVMRYYVWFGVCDPNEVSRSSALIEYREHVFTRFTESGARFVFDAIQKLEVDISPSCLEATGDEIVELNERLAAGEIAELNERDRALVRRRLRDALDVFRAS